MMIGPLGPQERKNWKNNQKYLIPYFIVSLLAIYVLGDTSLGDVLAILFIFGFCLFSMIDLRETFQKLLSKNWSGK